MKRFRLFLFALVALFSAVACTPKEEKIVIISTSDIHAKIEELPRLAAFVEEQRRENEGRVLLVDAGDRWTGNPYVDKASHAGRPIIEQMNKMGYDVATIGNHEFDMGLDTLQKRLDEAEFDIVLANIDTKESPLQQPKPYVIKRVGGVKVGFLGIVTNNANGHPDGKDVIFEGTEFFSPEWVAQRYGSAVRRKSDLMVVISHCGLDRDTVDLVNAFPYADLIVSGHTHELYSGEVNGIDIVQGNSKLRAVGVTTVSISGGKVVDVTTEYRTLPEEVCEVTKESVEEYFNDPYFNESVGTFTAEATKMGLAHFMADEGRRVAGADIGFYHIGGTRISSIAEGDVARARIFELEPFNSDMVITTMSYEEIEQMIFQKFNDRVNYKESHRVDLIPSGLRYTIVTDKSGDAVAVHLRPDVKKDLYKVAVSNYVYENKTYPYTRRAEEGRTPLVTTYLIDRLAEGPYTPDNTPRGVMK